jgi:hypothetical protein
MESCMRSGRPYALMASGVFQRGHAPPTVKVVPGVEGGTVACRAAEKNWLYDLSAVEI